MNWTDEEIDKLFQESAGQMEVPYQDAFWTEMETLLPEKKKKKGLGWIIGGTLTCFGLIAAMILPSNPFSLQTAGNAPTNESKTQLQTGSLNASLTAVVVPGLTEESALESSTQPASSASQKPTADWEPSAPKRIITAKHIKPLPAGSIGKAASTDNMTDPAASNQETQIRMSPVQDNDHIDLTLDETRLPLLVIPSDSPQLESTAYGLLKPKARKNQFYAQIGFGMSQSYISGSNGNWMPALNLGAGYQFRPQGFGFSAGLNIQSSFTNNLEFTRRSKVYNYGSTNYEQNFKYRQLYSIELPVSIDFKANRHVISVGIAPTYLATTVMQFSQSEDGKMEENRNYIGQRTGMNSFGLKPSIAYQIELNKSWYLGIQLSAQVIKQIDNTQFVGDYNRLPLNGQITIRKTIMR